jgi:hypothetical protein
MGKGLPGGRRQAGRIDYRTEPWSSLPHPALPRSIHASRSHYEIRPIDPPLVGGGGGACSSRTSV